MQKRRTALIAAICALALLCVFAVSFLVSSISYQTDRFQVTLPGEASDAEEIGENIVGKPQVDSFDLPELTPNNVQSVIAALDRPDEYVSSVSNTIYLTDGTTGGWSANSYVKNDAQRVERLNSAGIPALVFLYYEDRAYAWESGSSTYWSGASGDLSADMAAMIPSYEEVCALPVESITQTSLLYLDGEPCISVTCGQEETTYLISCVSGLLKNVKYYEDGELVREVSVTSSEEELGDALFALPDVETPIFDRQ